MRFGCRKPFSVLLFCLVASLNNAFCQPYYFTHYQVEDGLSNNAVMCSLQDNQGFMWFGTRDGLNRFDGLSFKVFRNIPADTTSIGSNAVLSLCESRDKKKLWIGTEKGLFQYEVATEKFQQLPVAGNVSITHVKVFGSAIWYISLYTLRTYDEATGQLKTYKINKEVTDYCLLKDGSLWVVTSAGTVAHYDTATDRFIEYDLFAHSPYAVSKSIASVFSADDGLLLVGTSNQGLKSFDLSTKKYKDVLTFDPSHKEIIVRDVIAVDTNEYWVATQSGIYILNMRTGLHQQLKRERTDPYSLSDNIVHTLCKDREGGIWAGTYFGGINYYPPPFVTFKKYFPIPAQNAISGSAVREISSDKNGNLWIGTEDAGLNKLYTSTGEFINYTPEKIPQSVSYSNTHGLLTYKNEVWVGTYLYGLDVLDINTGRRKKHFNTGNSAIGSNFIYSLFKTKEDEIIAATDKGLYLYLPNKADFKLVTVAPNTFYRKLCEDDSGNIWAGTYGDGIRMFNFRTGKQRHFSFLPDDSTSLSSNLINDIFVDSKGRMWIATEEGVCLYDKKSNRFKRFTTHNGLPSNVTYSILEDGGNNLWISTSKGLARLSLSNYKFTVYTKAHGLLTDQFNYNSAFKDAGGQMYFGSVKGMISFHPDSINQNQFSPPVYITGFQVYGKELQIEASGSPLKNAITHTKEITLAYDQSSFSIDFAALSYSAPGTIKYAYKMDGLDDDWVHLETARKVYFTQLAPGRYTFQIKAADGSADGYGNPATLQINVLPPPWKSWWAYTLYTVAFSLLSYFVVKHFYNRAKERQRRRLEKMEYEKERENYKDKLQFFTNIAHEIRTPLTLIKGPMENLMDEAEALPAIKSSLALMNRNTDRLLHLSNQLLDFRKAELDGFRLSFTQEDIAEILRNVAANFQTAVLQKNIKASVHIPLHFFAAVDAEAFNKIIINLWDNAVKYAESEVQVSLERSEDEKNYSITFKNDGYLIPEEMSEKIFESFYRVAQTSRLPGTGIGLTLARSLAQMHGGSLHLQAGNQQYNVFVLTFPLDPKQDA